MQQKQISFKHLQSSADTAMHETHRKANENILFRQT